MNTIKIFFIFIALTASWHVQSQIFSDSFEDPIPDRTKAIAFLNRTTFGPINGEINAVIQDGYENWLDTQILLPPTLHLSGIEALLPGDLGQNERQRVWWDVALNSQDQLRQRIAFALSEIFVVSDQNSDLWNTPLGMTNYYDILVRNAFGNYRQLLEEITLSPVMGTYLSMRGSTRDNFSGIEPDENYSREVMQLFSIGLVELNTNGSIKKDSENQPIPTYNQNHIIALAEVFTGWNFAGANQSDPGESEPNNCAWWEWMYPQRNWVEPMEPCVVVRTYGDQPDNYHVTTAKTIVGGTVLSANQTAEQDMQQALDTLANHPNVGPFLSLRLIQRLVTSNPSPAYIDRVASTFNDNGSGVRGDLKAVVKAILTDAEALNGATASNQDFGKLREPLLRITHLLRVYDATVNTECFETDCWAGAVYRPERFFGQAALRATSVFNFFKPDYSQPGTIESAGLLSPEFQITTESQLISLDNFLFSTMVQQGPPDFPWQTPYQIRIDTLSPLADQPEALVDQVSEDLLGMPAPVAVREAIAARITSLPSWADSPTRRVTETIYYIATSPQYVVQK